MTDFLGLNRAIPSAPLLNRDDPGRLGFETTSWQHLNRYVQAVEHLPAGIDGSLAVAKVVARLRSVVGDFGSPQQLQALIKDNANALAAEQPPQTLYAGTAWMVDHLHRSARSITETLQNFASLSGSPGAVKTALRQLGGDAEQARRAIGPMVEALKGFKTAVLDANGALTTAFAQDADTLRQMQEDVGRLTAKADAVEQQIAKLGFFSSGKKHELEQELAALSQQKAALSDRSEAVRMALAGVELVQNEGFWLESGVDDLVGFLDRLRQVLTTFGSGLTQVAADAPEAKLQEAAGMEPILGTATAISQWNAIAAAAEKFLNRSTVAFADAGEQP